MKEHDIRLAIPSATRGGYETAMIGDSINISYPNSTTRRGRVGKGFAQTITTEEAQCVVEPCAYDEQNGYLRNDGTVGSLTTDGSSPKHNNRIVEPIVYDDYNGRIRADQDTIGCITTNFGNDAPRNAQKIIEPITTRGEDVASTIRASLHKQGERNLLENMKNGRGYEGVIEPKLVGGFGEMKSNGGTQYYQQDRIYDGEEIAMCHPASITGGSYNYQVQDYRVRKLTERECFRLQGVKDEDFERVRANQSKSSCYL